MNIFHKQMQFKEHPMVVEWEEGEDQAPVVQQDITSSPFHSPRLVGRKPQGPPGRPYGLNRTFGQNPTEFPPFSGGKIPNLKGGGYYNIYTVNNKN